MSLSCAGLDNCRALIATLQLRDNLVRDAFQAGAAFRSVGRRRHHENARNPTVPARALEVLNVTLLLGHDSQIEMAASRVLAEVKPVMAG